MVLIADTNESENFFSVSDCHSTYVGLFVDDAHDLLRVIRRETTMQNTYRTFGNGQCATRESRRVLLKDGSSTQEIEVEYPIGHRRRRNEGIPVLENKFLSNLKTIFDEEKSEEIYKEFLDFDKLTSMSVVDFQKLLSL